MKKAVEAASRAPENDELPQLAHTVNFHESFVLMHHPANLCAETGCQRPFYSRGLCRNHYRSWRRGTLVPRQRPEDVVWRAGGANQ